MLLASCTNDESSGMMLCWLTAGRRATRCASFTDVARIVQAVNSKRRRSPSSGACSATFLKIDDSTCVFVAISVLGAPGGMRTNRGNRYGNRFAGVCRNARRYSLLNSGAQKLLKLIENMIAAVSPLL